MKVIVVKDILGSELRSRSSVSLLKQEMKNDKNFILDMTGVTFMSRSFADELCELKSSVSFSIANAITFVDDMLSIVEKSRNSKRTYRESNSQIINCNSKESLFALFS